MARIVESGVAADDERDRAADVEEMREFRVAVAGQTHHRHGAGAQQPEQGDGELAAVRQLQQDGVPVPDSHRVKPRRGGIRALVQFGVGEAGPIVDDGRVVGPALGGGAQDLVEGLAGPITGLAVGRGAVWRERA